MKMIGKPKPRGKKLHHPTWTVLRHICGGDLEPFTALGYSVKLQASVCQLVGLPDSAWQVCSDGLRWADGGASLRGMLSLAEEARDARHHSNRATCSSSMRDRVRRAAPWGRARLTCDLPYQPAA